MAIDTETSQSPGWWLKRLITKLGDAQARYDKLDEYYRCENGIPIGATKSVREAYRRLMWMSRTNFAELICSAVEEREEVVGFRTGAEGDDLDDKEAWRIWQANDLDNGSSLVHTGKLSMADSYVIVGPTAADIGAPLITPEDPREVITEQDPRNRRRTLAALKVFYDDVNGQDRAYLYLPGLVYQAVRPNATGDAVAMNADGWDWLVTERLPAIVVPVVRFANRPNVAGASMGEFESHLPLLDRINYTILNRLEVVTMQAFRQRGIKGVPRTDENGDEIDYDDVFSADPGAMWQLPETADIWESASVDLGPILMSIKDDVQHLATVTETPSYRFSPDAASGSAEGASLQREGLVFKTKARNREASGPWEQVMSLAFTFAGDTVRASRPDMEIIWAPPETFSLSEKADAAAKAAKAGMPWRSVMTDIWGFSPQKVERMEAERAADAFLTPAAPAGA